MYNEYNVGVVTEALGDALGVKREFDYTAHVEKMEKAASILPARFPAFCAGCPHRATMWSLQRAVGGRKSVFYANDIGCYSMMTLEPIEWTDSLLCMGASLGVAAGVQYSIEEKVIVTIGDSTFFHACLPGIVNIVHHNDDVTIMVLDNAVTAMTGQQGHPGRKERAGGADGTKLDIEKVLRGLGLEQISHIDTFDDVKGNVKVLKEAIAHDGPSVVISHGECALYHFRNLRRAGAKEVPFYIDTDVCENVYACVNNFMCPAISVDMVSRHAGIDPALCVGCGVCAQLCPHGAIKSTAVKMGGENRPYTAADDYEALMKSADGGDGGAGGGDGGRGVKE
jgi:indolepyruvate ferredoxin oxidoreductase alpha subunit